MYPGPSSRTGDERAVSELVGYVILVGVVAVGVVGLLTAGLVLQEDVRTQSQTEAATQDISRIGGSLASLSQANNETTVSFSPEVADGLRLVDSGYVNVSVDRTCSASVSLRAIRYENGNGDTVAYEGGGVFRQSGDGGTAVDSPPPLRYENGTVDFQLANITGELRGDDLQFRMNGSTPTQDYDDRLFAGDCRRPTVVEVEIKSHYYTGWADHIRDEFPDSATVETWESNSTVRLTLDRDELPTAVDDSRNDVIDFEDKISIDESGPSITVVNKTGDNDYFVRGTPLDRGIQVGYQDDVVENTSNISRPPVDVVYVIDESGSMGNPASGDSDSKSEAAQEAAQLFNAYLTGRDRAGLVGFYDPVEDNSRYYPADGRLLTSDYDELNTTITTIEASGGTHANAGLRKANALLDVKSNSSRDKYVILLSDGKNDYNGLDDRLRERASEAANNNVTVFTIGFGPDPEADVLNDTATITGGEFYRASDKEELKAVFENISQRVTRSNQIVRPPTSMNVTANGEVHTPQIGGDADYIANASGFVNVNDPTAPTDFSLGFDAEPGDTMNISAVRYACDEYGLTGATYQHSGETWYETRCVDINESAPSTVIDSSAVDIYTDGDDVSSLLANGSAFWQGDLENETLAPYLNGTTLDLNSNEAVVVFRYSTSGDTRSRLLMLYEIGRASGETDLEYVVDFEVDEVEVDEADD